VEYFLEIALIRCIISEFVEGKNLYSRAIEQVLLTLEHLSKMIQSKVHNILKNPKIGPHKRQYFRGT